MGAGTVAECSHLIVSPAPKGSIRLDATGVEVASSQRCPVLIVTNLDRHIAILLGAVTVIAPVVSPAPSSAVGLDRAGEACAHGNAAPIGRFSDPYGDPSVGGAAIANLATAVVSPAPECVVSFQSTVV